MSDDQVTAMERCLKTESGLQEWWPRYVKGWCKADGDDCEPETSSPAP